MENQDSPQIRTTTQARQGVSVHGMRHVLGFGIAGAVIGLVIVWAIMSWAAN